MTGKARVSVFDRLGPTLPPDQLPSTTNRSVHLQKGRRHSLSVLVTEAEPRPVTALAASQAGTETDAHREPRVVRSRLLQQSLQQAERSRIKTSQQRQGGSPLDVCRRRPVARQTAESPKDQSPTSSHCSSGSRHSRGSQRQNRLQRSQARDGAQGRQPPQEAELANDTANSRVRGAAALAAERLQRKTGSCPVADAQLLLEQELQQRLQQSQAERRSAEELAEQVALQASRLMAEKARVQAEATALAQERDHLLERLEYMEQALQAREGHSRGSSSTSSPVKGGAQDPQALRQQLLALQREREDLLLLLEASLGGLQLSAADQERDSLLTCN